MTTTPPDAPTDEGPRVTRDEVRDLGRLRRSTHDRKVAGVAGGLARHLDIDPIILRVAFVVLAFFGGAGLILYAAGWALVPEDGAEHAPVHLDERSRTIALVAVTVIAALALVGDSWGAYWFPWPLAVIGVIAFVWLSRGNRGRPTDAVPGETGDGEVLGGSAPAARGYVAPPPDPRKRGPVLFWFTLALIAFAEGLLGILDVAGVPVADSAYPALAVGLVGAMLLVGSVMGRAGGLIALGLIASLGLVGATAADNFEGEEVRVTPTSADDVLDRYRITTGELVVDLSQVTDAEGLAGRTVAASAEVGSIQVIVPEELDVEVLVDIGGPGGYDLFDREGGGIGVSTTDRQEGTGDAGAELTIDADLQVGEIIVRSE